MDRTKKVAIFTVMAGICFIFLQTVACAEEPAVQPAAAETQTGASDVQPPPVNMGLEEATPPGYGAPDMPAMTENLQAEQEENEFEELDVPVPAEKAAPIRAKAEVLVKEEITQVGSFEVDHPETGDLLELQLTNIDPPVVEVVEGEYMVHGNFKDAKGGAYGVEVYLEEMGNGEYEIVDAIVESVDGKKVAEEAAE